MRSSGWIPPWEREVEQTTGRARRAIDSERRGLMVLAWIGGRPSSVVAEGRFRGMTAPEVAEETDQDVAYVRAALLDGIEPGRRRRRGRPLNEDGRARRRRAGVPEDLLEQPLEEIAERLGVSLQRVLQAVYRGGRRLRASDRRGG